MDDVRRVAFVTGRFLELQGLIPAAFGALLLWGVLATVVGGGPYGGAVQPLMTALIFTNLFTLSLYASYRRTFGDVIASRSQKLLGMLPTAAVFLGAIGDMWLALGGRRSGPSIAAIALASYAAGVVVRDWPWRAHHLITVSAGIAGAVVTAAVPAVGHGFDADPARTEAHLLAFVLIGVGMVVTGLCDHQLLARCLRLREDASGHQRLAQDTTSKRCWFGVAMVVATAVPLSLSDMWLPAFPSIVLVALMIVFMASALVDALRAIRNFPQGPIRPIQKGTVLDLHPAESVVFATIAILAAVQFVLLRAQPPALLGVALLAATAGLGMLSTRRRRFYRLMALSTVVALGAVATLPAARGFLALVCAVGAAVLLDALVDLWTHWRTGFDHAHTV